ncbi:MAG: hypothetical protein ISS24_01470 [Candidatus Omnitrophica bacterium]|nr:hypothetical protein [Candidatus Omnitrophota bacterium]
MVKALALFSGGLDSALAVKIVLDQGVQVEALYFVNAFLPARHNTEMGRRAGQLGAKLHVLDISQPHLELVRSPRYGYGGNMNPCIDCRIFMLKKAKAYMQSHRFHFLISGEVLGQRPMSQRKDTLNIIERDAGVKGLLLRPLSAKKLAPTLAEEKGWVDRDKLFDFSGRSRKPQLALSKKLGIKEYLAPAGGCLLTEVEFARKLRDLIASGKLDLDGVRLLKAGRHFRLKSLARIIVGRNEEENKYLLGLACDADILFKMRDFAGPLTLVRPVRAKACEEFATLVETAARLTARYSKGKDRESAWVDYWPKDAEDEKKSVLVTPAGEDLIEKLRI